MFASLGFWEWVILAISHALAGGVGLVAGAILFAIYDTSNHK